MCVKPSVLCRCIKSVTQMQPGDCFSGFQSSTRRDATGMDSFSESTVCIKASVSGEDVSSRHANAIPAVVPGPKQSVKSTSTFINPQYSHVSDWVTYSGLLWHKDSKWSVYCGWCWRQGPRILLLSRHSKERSADAPKDDCGKQGLTSDMGKAL